MACVVGQAVVNAAMRPVFLRLLSDDEKYLADLMHGLWLPTQPAVFAAGFALYYVLAPRLARPAVTPSRRRSATGLRRA